ncbi:MULTISPECIES: TetR/AcrR family transcriptional regulator [unclassified Hyphomonas]|uniref:TetR/AcrR family transcriptional regulator n=1 Tax=unclassified Hyphomonas TaxID=2630699 RepID=UPI000DF01F8E|nr:MULTISPECIES: TetR/AcrR family transcriptional regulator [unclassified Hyphomonas]AXE64977.1 hypothetical protein BBF93_12640 [Hyphomonas sp. CACIAM 19H1]
MSARSADPRFSRSRAALIGAVADLVREKPVEDVSITQIANSAGVTRPTFYQHFENVPAATRAAALSRLADAYPRVALPATATATDTREALEARAASVLEHLWRDRTFYRRVIDGAGSADFFDALMEIVADRMMLPAFHHSVRQTASERDRKRVLAGGIMWLVVRWLRTEQGAVRPQTMARRITDIAMKMGDV